MRVLFVSPTYLPAVGGAERQMALLGRALQERGHVVHILTHRRTGSPDIEVTPSGTVYRTLPERLPERLYAPIIVFRTAAWLLLHGGRYDAVHCMFLSVHAFAIAWLAGLLEYRWGARMAGSAESGELHAFPGGRRRRAFLRTLNHADWLVALSTAARDEMIHAGLDPTRIVVVPNAVDISRFACPGRAYSRADRWLYVGRLVPVKNLDSLLEAFAGPEFASCRLTVAGDGPLKRGLADHAAAVGVAERVRFIGPVNDPARLYAEHDLFVLPSRAEGLSNALLEAMAAGMVCVSTPAGGARDLIRDNENGILAKRPTPADLRTALHRATALPPDARERLGQAARETVARRCSVQTVVTRLANLFAGSTAPHPTGHLPEFYAQANTEETYGREYVAQQNRWLWEGMENPDAGYGPRIRRLLERMGPVQKNARVLDLGCGVGTFALVLAQKGVRTVGLDISAEAAAAAHANARRLGVHSCASFVQADAANGGVFPPDSFDLIVAADLAEHLPPPILEAVLRNCRRWLRPGGRLFVHTFPTRFYYLLSCEDRILHALVQPLHFLPVPLGRAYLHLLHRATVPFLYWFRFGETYEQQIARTAHCNPPHPEEFRRVLEQAGFIVESYEATAEILTGLPGDQPKRPGFRRLMERFDLLKPAIIVLARKPAPE